MKEIRIDEAKRIQVDILSQIDDFCRCNGLVYTLAFGTLIGAIRHNGFIPWDDDIDIVMPRKDYEVFCETYTGDNTRVICQKKDKAYPYPFAKVFDIRTILLEATKAKYEIGIYVDVFPIDFVPKDDKEKAKLYRKLNWFNRAYICKSVTREYKVDFVHRVYHLLMKVATFYMSIIDVVNIIDELASKNTYEKNRNVTCLTFRNGHKWELPYESYFTITQHIFEGKQFDIPVDYDACLRKIYGDYMQLPPEEKRVSNHINKSEWRE